MATAIKIATLTTPEPNKVIDVEVWYNDGGLRRAARGYWLAARLYTEEGYMRSTDMMNGSASDFLEPCQRYNAKRHAALAGAIKTLPIYQIVIDRLRAKNGMA